MHDPSAVEQWLRLLQDGSPAEQQLARTELGLLLEARGLLDEAAEAYARNVAEGVQDRRPYERLALLARQRGDAETEARALRALADLLRPPPPPASPPPPPPPQVVVVREPPPPPPEPAPDLALAAAAGPDMLPQAPLPDLSLATAAGADLAPIHAPFDLALAAAPADLAAPTILSGPVSETVRASTEMLPTGMPPAATDDGDSAPDAPANGSDDEAARDDTGDAAPSDVVDEVADGVSASDGSVDPAAPPDATTETNGADYPPPEPSAWSVSQPSGPERSAPEASGPAPPEPVTAHGISAAPTGAAEPAPIASPEAAVPLTSTERKVSDPDHAPQQPGVARWMLTLIGLVIAAVVVGAALMIPVSRPLNVTPPQVASSPAPLEVQVVGTAAARLPPPLPAALSAPSPVASPSPTPRP